ncbi:HD domain-containing protein [Nocardia uniformis]|uniref:HD domain-containing protein n=1 Tax=Nocardia uniformis TaxID=53432 RepID=A0A849BYK6_9NOCA|nr:HD domain-containing protein [Nocardia uniformis]NNH71633.1 HD domain-containing protein [Nocardia uniformis]
MTARLLLRALESPGDLALPPLPGEVRVLLEELDAPPRLAAHLRLVHDAARQIVVWVERDCPTVEFDRDAVIFGAATHDVGKIVHIEELSGPGSAHEQAGYELLLKLGVEERLARFARTHAAWGGPEIGLADLLVSVADKVWKGKRVTELEQLLIERLAADTGQQPWQVFSVLDQELDRIAADADRRLAFQAAFPVHGS